MKFLASDGLIIKKQNINDSDRLITVFSKTYGRLTLWVPGIQKSRRRHLNGVELLSLSKFIFYKKGERNITSSFELKSFFLSIREDIDKISLALYLLAWIEVLTLEGQRDSFLWVLINKVLSGLDKSTSYKRSLLLVAYFIFELVKNEGFGIHYLTSNGKYLDFERGEVIREKPALGVPLLDTSLQVITTFINKVKTNNDYNETDLIECIITLERYLSYHTHINNIKIKDFILKGE